MDIPSIETCTPKDFVHFNADELDTAIAEEITEWEKNNINPGAIQHSTFNINCRMIALELYIVQYFGGDEKEGQQEIMDGMNHMLKAVTLAELKNTRESVMPMMRRERLKAAGIDLPDLALPTHIKPVH